MCLAEPRIPERFILSGLSMGRDSFSALTLRFVSCASRETAKVAATNNTQWNDSRLRTLLMVRFETST